MTCVLALGAESESPKRLLNPSDAAMSDILGRRRGSCQAAKAGDAGGTK